MDEMLEMLVAAVEEIRRRSQEAADRGLRQSTEPVVTVVIDEAWVALRDDAVRVLAEKIARTGRMANVFLELRDSHPLVSVGDFGGSYVLRDMAVGGAVDVRISESAA